MSACHRCGCDPCITRGPVSVCGDCGATTAHGRAAKHADLETLSDDDVTALKQQLGRVRPHRRKSGRS